MTCKRFRKITETIHCNDNETNLPGGNPNHDKLRKVRPLITFINETIHDAYKPSKILAVDESVLPFKGRSSLKQYVLMKPVKRGYKVWCLTDSKTDYVMEFDVYSGKAGTSVRKLTLGERTVASKSEGTAANVEIESTTETRRVPVSVRIDNKPVTLLTTVVTRKIKDGSSVTVSCPTAVAPYNAIMGGVDKNYQFRERYTVCRYYQKWGHRILYFLTDLAIVNSYILWKFNRRDYVYQDQLSFRFGLARQLISGFSFKKQKGRPTSFLANKNNCSRLTKAGDHMPDLQKPYRRCRVCSKKVRDKRRQYICSACDVPLRIEPCFRKFHDKRFTSTPAHGTVSSRQVLRSPINHGND
ncbi:hypothetical protein PR048_026727 [Dryococelus australis]|uniref:PiggyBac transposable element-derived protein domain-containing protein n=1 Tax=Dryococelus australis TaxID=614101 RepID=A0ABQ9GM61_9NEOP|nr:hypothetical protein PR048_026727 [Dryococelus australis]